MTLTNYWIVIIWTLVAGIFLDSVINKRKEIIFGRTEFRWYPITSILFVLPYIIWAGYRGNFGDTEQYRKTFHEMSSGIAGFVDYYLHLKKDKLFYSFEYLFKTIFGDNDVLFFLFIAAVQMFILTAIYRKYSCDLWFSLFIFVASTDYFSWMYNGVRQFIAVTLILIGTPLFLKKKYILSILIIIFASRFHGSALLMIPIIFILQGKALNKRTILCIIASVIALAFVNRFTSILDTLLSDTQYTNVVSDWKAWKDDGMNPIRALVYSVPTMLTILGIKHIRSANNPVINFAANASFITTAISILAVGTSGIFIGRLPIYTSLYANGILLPWVINNVFDRTSASFIKIVAIFFYILFFYYQMHFTWSII